MKIKYYLLAITLGLIAMPAKAEVTIWNWAYVIEGTDELISGNGSSIFQIDGNNQTGPMYPSDKVTLRLKLSIDGTNVSGTLSPEEPKGETIQFTGLLSFEPIQGKKECTAIIKLSNGVNYVVLRRLSKSCKP